MSRPRTSVASALALALFVGPLVAGCGGAEKRVSDTEKQTIRNNADSADRDLDRASDKSED
jgi:hypothetical protein